MQTHSWMPRSARVVSRKGKGWWAGSGCTSMGSATDMGISLSTSTRTITPCGPGSSPPAEPSCSPLDSPSFIKLFFSSAASLYVEKNKMTKKKRMQLCPLSDACDLWLMICWLSSACGVADTGSPLRDQWFRALPPLIRASGRLESVYNGYRLVLCPPGWYKQPVRMCVMCRPDVRFIRLSGVWWTDGGVVLLGVCVDYPREQVSVWFTKNATSMCF